MLEVEDTFVEMARGYFIKPLAVFVSGKCFIKECWVAFSEAPGVSRFLEFCTIACSTKKRADLKLELFSKVVRKVGIVGLVHRPPVQARPWKSRPCQQGQNDH